jgi:hypothetical protein
MWVSRFRSIRTLLHNLLRKTYLPDGPESSGMIFVVKIAPLMQMAQEKRDKRPARLTVTLDERDHSEVCQLAEKNDVSAAWIIRRAVQYFLRDMSRPLNRRG